MLRRLRRNLSQGSFKCLVVAPRLFTKINFRYSLLGYLRFVILFRFDFYRGILKKSIKELHGIFGNCQED